MLQINLGPPQDQPDQNDPFLPRTMIGWHPGMSEAALFASARGWWRLNRTRAEKEEYAVIVADGLVRQIIRITEWTTHYQSGWHAFNGQIIKPGNSIHDRYAGKPLDRVSQNPIHYLDDSTY
jgi:hypothetical protein